MNHLSAKTKFIFCAIFVMGAIFLASLIFNPAPAAAQLTGSGGDPSSYLTGSDVPGDINPILGKSPGTEKTVNKLSWKRIADQLKTWARETLWRELKKAGDVAWKAALKNFLNTLAYDTATYIATGDKGQLPMFQTQGWGGYLKNVADNAAGTFIEELGKNSALKFNLCAPGSIMLRINLGLVKTVRPKAPACTFNQLVKNWDTAITQKDFLGKFQDMFNPWSNDLGVALTVQSGFGSEIDKAINEGIKDRQEASGFKSVTDAISGAIKTPGNLVRYATADAYGAAKQSALAYTGSVVADSIDIFINTLAGKLVEKWLRGGLVTKIPKLANKLDSLTNPNAHNPAEGLAGAEARMRSIVEPNFRVRADYDILAELATCQDPNKAGPTDCVIDEKFRQAIEKRMTVGQALKQGYLNGNGIFGFTSDGLEPKFNEGYPYRTMIILRKYRIIPVGWEIAAQKIKDQQDVVIGTKNLKNLVNCFSGDDEYGTKENAPWCDGLVDPDWVLKAPQNFCKREGAGPEIISEQVTGEGNASTLAILRDDTYCADERPCI